MNVNAHRITCLLIALISFHFTNAQYFQQDVDYHINVELNTRTHTLHGTWQMVYTNNSPDTLHTIYMHLYPNAYSSGETAFAQQQLRLGNYDFHFAEPRDRGAIDSLNFTIDGIQVPWSLDKAHPDIALLTLSKPLLPGSTVRLSTPMRVKIPKAFSRLGRIRDTYQITQWYPKPAVYDQTGWHPMPYLSQGEFYSEFGTYNVRITLPAHYLVAATGSLQSQYLRFYLDSLAEKIYLPLADSPTSSTQKLTWEYRAEKVHDFAWFADPKFAVRKKTIDIGGKPVSCWAFFTDYEKDLWENATDYIADALQFYSDQVGPYPYPQMTAVQIPFGKDYGMEYPMITSINLAGDAEALDEVITHEVGHNWFYGILGFNERKHAWMDEGINTFYEFQHMREKYQTWSQHILLYKPNDPDKLSDEQRILQHLTAKQALVAPDGDPEIMTEWQTFFGAYYKPALAFDMLQDYLGKPLFQNAMQDFFSTWKFGHPQPADLRDHLEGYCDCDLSWLFEGILLTDGLIDYRIVDFLDHILTIENRGEIVAPVKIKVLNDETVVYEHWHDGFQNTATFHIAEDDVDRIEIYDEVYSLDLTPTNNIIRVKNGKSTAPKLKLRIIGGKSYPGEQYLNLLPVVATNVVDKTMLGLAISNSHWPPGKLQWGIVPLYSTNTRSLTGLGDVQYQWIPKGRSFEVELGLGLKSFHFDEDTHYGFVNRYLKIAPRLRLTFGDRRAQLKTTHSLQYRYASVRQDYGRGLNFDEFIWEKRSRTYGVHELRYDLNKERHLGSEQLAGLLHVGKGFVRVSADLKKQVIYHERRRSVYLHLFGGALPYYNNPHANVNLNFNGIQSTGIASRDYMYDEWLLARNAEKGIESQFVFLKDAQLKTLYNGGLSDQWMLSAGISADLPIPIPIQPYFDLAVYHDPFEDQVGVSYSGGLSIVFKKDVAEIFLPIVESSDIRESLTYTERDTFLKRISILLDLKAFNPHRFSGYQ